MNKSWSEAAFDWQLRVEQAEDEVNRLTAKLDEYKREWESCCERERARWIREQELTADLARLTAERDQHKEAAIEMSLQRDGASKNFWRVEVENKELRADLAAARATLETWARRLRTLAALHSGDEHPVLETGILDAAKHLEGVLSRLGTGEALSAVREAQKLMAAVRVDGWYKQTTGRVMDSLKAVFGEGEKR